MCRSHSHSDISQHGGVRGAVYADWHHDSRPSALPGHRPASQEPIWHWVSHPRLLLRETSAAVASLVNKLQMCPIVTCDYASDVSNSVVVSVLMHMYRYQKLFSIPKRLF